MRRARADSIRSRGSAGLTWATWMLALLAAPALGSVAQEPASGGEEPLQDPLSEVLEAPMSPPVGSHRILSGESSVRVPFEVVNGDIVLDVKVNGVPLRLGLDNGRMHDDLFLYGGPRIDALELESIETLEVGGSGEGAAIGGFRFAPVDLQLEGVEILEQPGIVTDPSGGLAAMFGEDGNIGGSIFKHFVVRIDVDAGVLVLTEPEAFTAPEEASRVPLTRLASESYTMPVSVELHDGTRLELDLGIDLGGIRHLLLFDDGHREVHVPEGAVAGVYGAGVQGDIPGRVASIALIELGSFAVANVPTWFVSREVVRGLGNAGMCGFPLLELFNTTWDYGRRCVYLEPARRFRGEGFLDLKER